MTDDQLIAATTRYSNAVSLIKFITLGEDGFLADIRVLSFVNFNKKNLVNLYITLVLNNT